MGVAKMLSRAEVQTGAALSMEQCWHKLKDAAFLYAHGSYANAYVLAVSAREELGRAGFIWDFLDRMADGECCAANVLIEYIKKGGGKKSLSATETHTAKLRRGQSSNTFRGAPERAHDRRMKAQYVELDEQGVWLSPRSIEPEETRVLILVTAADLAQCLQTAFLDPMFTSVCAASGVSLPDAFGAVEEVTLRLAMRRD
jgi:AbiV family abortive infection protein